MKPLQKIEHTLNYSLYNQIPNKWKACELYFKFKENGFEPASRERFSNDLSLFYETRTKTNEAPLFFQLFNIKFSAELKRECTLHYGDISVNTKKVSQIASTLGEFFTLIFKGAGVLNDPKLLLKALTAMYSIHYYDQTYHFTFSRFKAELLDHARKEYSEKRIEELTSLLESLNPDPNEKILNQNDSSLSLPSDLIRDDKVDSISNAHSLTQAEIDWLNELSSFSEEEEFNASPKIRGTAVKSDSEYPESIRSLLKTTREYDQRIGHNPRISKELKHTVRQGIASVAREILIRYQKAG